MSKSIKKVTAQMPKNPSTGYCFTFKTNGGPQVVEITDQKIIDFINETWYYECYGEKPSHPIDFCQIAYQRYMDDEISEDDYKYYTAKFTEIMKNFKYA